MSLVFLNFLIWAITLIAAIGFTIILTTVNPFNASLTYISLFFTSFFILTGGVLTIIGYYLRDFISKKSGLSSLFTSFRQGFLVSLYLTSLIILYATNTFALWQAILLLIVTILLEFYFR